MKEDLITNTFVRIQKKLFAQAARILYDNDSAEDVLMETFCRAYEKQYPVASDSEAERILFRIVRNMSVSELRKRRRPGIRIPAIGNDLKLIRPRLSLRHHGWSIPAYPSY